MATRAEDAARPGRVRRHLPVHPSQLHLPHRLLWGRPLLAVAMALVGLVASLSPSLIPRPLGLQAIDSAVSVLVGYGLGALVQTIGGLVGRVLGVHVEVHLSPGRRPQVTLAALLVLATGAAWAAGHRGRVTTARLVQVPPPTWWDDIRALLLAALIASVLLGIGIGIHRLLHRAVLRVARFLPRGVATVLVVAVFASATTWVMRSVVASRLMNAVSTRYVQINDEVPQGARRPTSRLVSGGPGSRQDWHQLGYNGMAFTSNAPTAAGITKVTGRPAVDPIRVYTAPTSEVADPQQLAALTVEELRRTGAFDRPRLLLIGTTGRGWIDDYAVGSFEYLTDGDCASAAVRYSHLPSGLAFVTERSVPQAVGRATVDAVRAEIARRPAGHRPQLYLTGESLGSFGLQAAFSTTEQEVSEVSGALWIGTPNSTPLWRATSAGSHVGSPEVAPVYRNGEHIRFATAPADLGRDRFGRELGAWGSPRIVYLQHASDPVVWWDASLLFKQPRWTVEDAGSDVNPGMRWWPVFTWWMVGLDMPVAQTVPAGHGHTYEAEVIDCWAAILDVPLDRTERTRIASTISTAVR